MLNLSALSSVVLTVVLRDRHALHAARVASQTYLSEFPNSILYGDDSSCWNTTCATASVHAPCRLENALRCTAERFRGRLAARWYVFTSEGVWWHAEGLLAELERAAALLAPAAPAQDALLFGGGGLLTFSEFMILSNRIVESGYRPVHLLLYA